ncbi:MAG TPA: uracil-DNA glycosylase family protein [Thermoanaerobaculia bacterium]|nr:uracil-DNA glycosylase family protein [Thermoanaerobaculia bacterium]
MDAELEQIQPKAIVALGSTAAQALLGKGFKVTKQRGELVDSDLAPLVTATVHPSSILRAPSDDDRAKAMSEFVADLTNLANDEVMAEDMIVRPLECGFELAHVHVHRFSQRCHVTPPGIPPLLR